MITDDKKSILERVNFFLCFFHLIWPIIKSKPETNKEDENVYLLWLVKILTVIDTNIVFAVQHSGNEVNLGATFSKSRVNCLASASASAHFYA